MHQHEKTNDGNDEQRDGNATCLDTFAIEHILWRDRELALGADGRCQSAQVVATARAHRVTMCEDFLNGLAHINSI